MDSTPDLPPSDADKGTLPDADKGKLSDATGEPANGAMGDASTDPHLPPEVAGLEDSPSAQELPDDDLAAAKTVIRKAGGGTPANALGHSPAEIASVLLGHHLNHFQLNQLIGGGGMGAVFSAHDTRLDRTVAIKVIPRVGEDPDLLRRFRNEAQSAAKLDHPHIARVYDVGRHDDWHYIVFEFIEGTNIRDLVARDGVLSIDDAVYYARQVAEALDHAHQRGIVHRDIKPSNVLLRPDGQVKVVDMGLARTMQLEVSGDMTASGVTLGTFDYISPEQARDPRDADVRSDIYSLGCTLYYMLTGRPPYPGGTVLQKLLSHGNSPPPDPRELRLEVSDDLTAILHKMLAKRPGDRYRRPLDLLADLAELARRENLQRSLGLGTLSIPGGNSWLTRLERHLPWFAAAAVLLLSVAWLQLLSSVSALDVSVPRPLASAAELISEDAPTADAEPSDDSDSTAVAVPDVTADAVVEDEAMQPPQITEIPVPAELQGSETPSIVSLPTPDTTLAATKIRVGGPVDAASDELVASTFSAALSLAAEHNIQRIEIASPLISSPPLVIEQSGLVIVGPETGCQIRFESSPLLAMENAVMVDIGEHRIRFENLQFHWKVPSNAVHGGALFHVAANRGVYLENCAITIDNANGREPINAFHIGVAPPPSSSEGTVSTGPPLVAIDLQDVIARGQMTLMRMSDAAQLQLRWENGLLAVSQRLLETGGALSKPPAGRTQLKLLLRDVTAYLPQGLAVQNLGPSGTVPVVINRNCTNCAFTTDMGSAHIEINSVADLNDGPLILLAGSGNHYDSGTGKSDRIVAISDQQDDSVLYRLSDLAGNSPPAWMKEQAPQSVINWTQPTAVDQNPTHLMTPQDFQQDGTVVPGFDGDQLPQLLPAQVPAVSERVSATP
ncbi:serine/threonine-protein kinase [Roseimaritima ulvae]|uniref:non-specific serine/threonine protein kinase n=1 Tax=Roseimaritima ulvae TaxID=980254 RepID=A0A5B9QKC9_9BACT|nr:serine/threonine-protein kinase [Roseimaritima ulvae]QEG38449.1 Serine/threonine-protein kinase PknB [Roseimaritima ulvae]